jgi:hypothetical protein
MTFTEYQALFDDILSKSAEEHTAPYSNHAYLEYVKLNRSRMSRWFKTGKLSPKLMELVEKITTPQQWIVITEAWCGDASHSVPFMKMMADLNPLIDLSFELRDSEPYNIEHYLTNGTRSIPKLVVRDADGKDIGTWGPRPKDCQIMYKTLLSNQASSETIKIEMQNWYNNNKGVDIQEELYEMLSMAMEETVLPGDI